VRHLAGELPAPEDHDGLRRFVGFVHDLDLAELDNEKLEVAVANLNKLLPVPVALQRHPDTAPQRGNLRLVEPGDGDSV
jgi:hypothetical protein